MNLCHLTSSGGGSTQIKISTSGNLSADKLVNSEAGPMYLPCADEPVMSGNNVLWLTDTAAASQLVGEDSALQITIEYNSNWIDSGQKHYKLTGVVSYLTNYKTWQHWEVNVTRAIDCATGKHVPLSMNECYVITFYSPREVIYSDAEFDHAAGSHYSAILSIDGTIDKFDLLKDFKCANNSIEPKSEAIVRRKL